MCIGREGLEVVGIRRQDCVSSLGRSHHQRVHCRAFACARAQKRCSSRERLSDALDNVAGFQKPIFSSIAARMPLKAFDQHDRRNPRWPEAFFAKRQE